MELADDLSVALLMALERLSPLERAAFLLHDVFDLGFPEVAEAIGRNEAACRQLAARARRHVRETRPRFPVSREAEARVAEAFLAASRGGDVDGLRRLLAEDAVAYTDGGGRRPAALNPVRGRPRLLRFYAGLARKAEGQAPVVVHRGRINGMAGYVTLEPDGILQTTALDIRTVSSRPSTSCAIRKSWSTSPGVSVPPARDPLFRGAAVPPCRKPGSRRRRWCRRLPRSRTRPVRRGG